MVAHSELALRRKVDETLVRKRAVLRFFYARASAFEISLLESALTAQLMIKSIEEAPELDDSVRDSLRPIVRELEFVRDRFETALRLCTTFLQLSISERNQFDTELPPR